MPLSSFPLEAPLKPQNGDFFFPKGIKGWGGGKGTKFQQLKADGPEITNINDQRKLSLKPRVEKSRDPP